MVSIGNRTSGGGDGGGGVSGIDDDRGDGDDDSPNESQALPLFGDHISELLL